MKLPAITVIVAGAVAFLPAVSALASVTTNGTTVVYDRMQSVHADFLQTTETTVCPGCRISEIVSISAMMDGNYIGDARSAVALIYDRTETSFTVQFQINDGLTKTVRAYFRQQGDDIVGRAEKAGYDSVPLFTRLHDSKFTNEPATTDSNGSYGVYNLQFFGKTTWVADAFPVVDGKFADLVVSNGTLQVNVAENTVFTNAISGNGAVVFKGSNSSAAVKNVTFANWLSTADKVILPNTRLKDIEVVSGVLKGGWISESSAHPYNVTTNADGSVKVQLQRQLPNSTDIKGVSFMMIQKGDDVVARALMARQAGRGQELGSNLEEWNNHGTGNPPAVATSATSSGYGIESIVFRVRDTVQLWLRGPKKMKGGMVADDLVVNVETNKFGNYYVRVKAQNGGEVVMRTAYSYADYPRLSYEVGPGCRLVNDAAHGINLGDIVAVDGGVFEQIAGRNTYANHVDFSNVARLKGQKFRIGYKENASWTTAGDGPIVVESTLETYCENNMNITFTLDAATDIVFLGALTPAPNYAGTRLLKAGAGTAIFSNTVSSANGALTLREGTVVFAANATFSSLSVEGNVTVKVDGDAMVSFGDSSSIDWSAANTVNFTGIFAENSHAVRFGTNAAGLSRTQLKQVSVNGERADLDENGYLRKRKPKGLAIAFR